MSAGLETVGVASAPAAAPPDLDGPPLNTSPPRTLAAPGATAGPDRALAEPGADASHESAADGARPESGPAGDAGSPAAAGTARGLRARLGDRRVRTHLGTVAGVLILGVLLWRLGTGVFLDGLRRIDGTTLWAAIGIGLLTTVFSAWRWCLVARELRIRLPLGAAVADYYRALFLNAALPGGVLGDVHRAVRHGQSTGDIGRGVRAVVLERTAGQAVLVAVGAVVLLTQPSPVLAESREAALILAIVSVCGVVTVGAVRRGRAPVGAVRYGAVRGALTEARGALLARGSWPGVTLSSVLVLAGHLTMFVLAARVAGSTASVAQLMPLALLALLAMGLPLNIGGWGPREGVTAWAFGAAGLGAGMGLTVAVIYGVLSFAASLPGAAVLVVRWGAALRRPSGESAGGPDQCSVSDATSEKYAPNASASPARSSFPFSARAIEGRPMTPDSV
ncbi:flippase-like domain-containing protein [Streptomyces sp. NBC_00647]